MVAELAAHIGSAAELTYSTNHGLVEVVPAGITKASGIQELITPRGIGIEQVVAFGDMPNDLPMLLQAGHGVAMGNAHPEVLAAAAEITTPNTDDGLARVLERIFAR
jgi:hydroxymethylpyrimidine pyrophosphatase-like HAD family hydrolase